MDIQAIFFRRRHQPRRPPLAKTRPVPKAKACSPWKGSTLASSLAIKGSLKSSADELTTASRQGEKTSARCDQTGQASADDRSRHRDTKVNDASGAVIIVQHIRREECVGRISAHGRSL